MDELPQMLVPMIIRVVVVGDQAVYDGRVVKVQDVVVGQLLRRQTCLDAPAGLGLQVDQVGIQVGDEAARYFRTAGLEINVPVFFPQVLGKAALEMLQASAEGVRLVQGGSVVCSPSAASKSAQRS